MLILLSYEGEPGDLVEIPNLPFKKIHNLIQRWIHWRDHLPWSVYKDDEFDGTFATFVRNKGYQAIDMPYDQVSGNDAYVY